MQRDIILYSYGLFSLLPVAALPVKPVLLHIYECYFLPLGDALNPVLTGLLIGLFSSLEEGAEYFDRVIHLLDQLANRIDEFYFYTCLWSATHLVSPVRHPAITFVINHFDKRKSLHDQSQLIGLSVETMVKSEAIEVVTEIALLCFFFFRDSRCLYMSRRSGTFSCSTNDSRFCSTCFAHPSATIK